VTLNFIYTIIFWSSRAADDSRAVTEQHMFRTPAVQTLNQASNQLGTPGGAKSFLIGVRIF